MDRSRASWGIAVAVVLLAGVGCTVTSGKSDAADSGATADSAPSVDAGGDTPDSGSGVFVDGGKEAGAAACGGADFVSCNNIQADGTGECSEASGFGGAVQKQLFVDACDGTLSSSPCPRAVPNTGGCTQPSTFCWVAWGYQPDDPSTPENEYEEGKVAYKDACAASGGKYLSP